MIHAFSIRNISDLDRALCFLKFWWLVGEGVSYFWNNILTVFRSPWFLNFFNFLYDICDNWQVSVEILWIVNFRFLWPLIVNLGIFPMVIIDLEVPWEGLTDGFHDRGCNKSNNIMTCYYFYCTLGQGIRQWAIINGPHGYALFPRIDHHCYV